MQEQLVALGAVFEAAVLVDKLAKTGQVGEPGLACMLGSLLVRDPQSTLDVYGGDDLNLREGYRALIGALERDPASLQREPLRYALALDQIQNQVGQFGLVHDNVIAACGSLYEDTISTFRQRIQVQGDMRHLQQASNASKIRALLLAGIRSARLWRQLGGHRWQLVFSRGKLLKELYPLLRG
jgi:high frequency lysogenization protein